jgi:hypothetical protein
MNLNRRLPFVLAIILLSAGIAAGQSTGRLANISSRIFCQTREAVLVTEFIAYGRGNESFALRALGPSLPGVSTPLQDPTLRLLDVRGRTLDFNDNWMDSPDKDEIIALGLAPPNDLESAMVDTVRAGAYTSVVQGAHHGEGTALSEVFDLFDGALQLSAVGARGFVGTEGDEMISGAIISGSGPVSVLLRALGPSLADAGFPGVLPNPTLEVRDSNGDLIAANDDWREGGQEAEILATGLAPTDDLESALITALTPGIYTAIVNAGGGATGLGFVQWYSLDAPVRELNPAPVLRRRR